MFRRSLMVAAPLAICAALIIPVAACGGDDDDDDSSSSATSCSCECACCASLGNCDTPTALTAANSDECDQGCSDSCGGSYSNSYSCS